MPLVFGFIDFSVRSGIRCSYLMMVIRVDLFLVLYTVLNRWHGVIRYFYVFDFDIEFAYNRSDGRCRY